MKALASFFDMDPQDGRITDPRYDAAMTLQVNYGCIPIYFPYRMNVKWGGKDRWLTYWQLVDYDADKGDVKFIYPFRRALANADDLWGRTAIMHGEFPKKFIKWLDERVHVLRKKGERMAIEQERRDTVELP